MAAEEPVAPKLVAGKQALLNILIEGAKGDTEERCGILGIDETVIIRGGTFFPSSKRRKVWGTSCAQKSQWSLAVAPFTRFQPHEIREGRERAGQDD